MKIIKALPIKVCRFKGCAALKPKIIKLKGNIVDFSTYITPFAYFNPKYQKEFMTESDAKSIVRTISLEEAMAHPLLIAINVSLGNVHKLNFDENKSIYLISETQYNKHCKDFLEEKEILA